MRTVRCFNLFIALLLYATSCATTGIGSHTASNLRNASAQRARAVKVSVTCGSSSGYGSGVIVANRSVLTAAHVPECAGVPTITITDADGVDRPARVSMRARDGADAVRLELTGGEDFHVPAVRWAGPPALDHMICVATAGPVRSRSCGIVQEIRGNAELRSTWPADFGNSGSGVYDEQGNLIGLLVKLVPANWGGVGGSIVELRIAGLLGL